MRPRVVIAHHTASFWTTPDSTVTNLLVNGRVDLPGPLCHLGLNRDGTYIVIAGGKANHAGAGSWMDANESVEAIGIEGYNYGNGAPFPSREPWPQVQLDAYDRGVAALLSHLNRDERFLCAHREWATPPGRKPDPSGIDMHAMRRRVAYLLEDEMVLREGPGVVNAVKVVQAALNKQGNAGVTVDGVFGPRTTDAVKTYQSSAGVPATGVVDGVTLALLVRYVPA